MQLTRYQIYYKNLKEYVTQKYTKNVTRAARAAIHKTITRKDKREKIS